jgi:excisionase family DNA binding protein
MNVYEVAEALGISPSTVRNQCEKGVMVATKIGRLWDVSPEEVERYRTVHRGSRVAQSAALRRIHADAALDAKRRAALADPATKAKQRAAKLGKPQSAAHVAKRAAGHVGKPLSAAHRESIAAAQRGKTLDPEHHANLRKYHMTRRGKPLSLATKRRIAESLAKAYAEGRRSYSTLEDRAADWLLPLGFVRNVVLEHHVFDFGLPDESMLVEVNGCAWHDHRARKPSCPIKVRRDSSSKDEERRGIARLHDRILVELWQCEEATWPDVIALIGIPALDA